MQRICTFLAWANLRRLRIGSAAAGLLLACVLVVAAQEADERPSIDADAAAAENSAAEPPVYRRTPYDILRIEGEGATYRVQFVELEGPRLPEKPLSNDVLRFRIDGELREVKWKLVTEAKLFDEVVLAEARRLTGAGETNAAYEHLDFLLREYPEVPGLAAAVNEFLYADAGRSLEADQPEQALSALLELHVRQQDYPGLQERMGKVVDTLVTERWERENYAAGRDLLREHLKRFRNETVGRGWVQKFSNTASALIDEAQDELHNENFSAAGIKAAHAVRIWPTHSAGKEVLAEAHEKFPVVRVGVTHAGDPHGPQRIDDPASQRMRRLVERQLFEGVRFGGQGVEYTSPLGTLEPLDVNLRLRFRLNPGVRSATGEELTAYELSRRLLRLARPGAAGYRSDWAQFFVAAGIHDVYELEVQLRRPHVKPEALLQSVLAGDVLEVSGLEGAYRAQSIEGGETHFLATEIQRQNFPQAPAEIVEVHFNSSREALEAFSQGLVDVLAHVAPWEVRSLEQLENVHVAHYAAPQVHCLVPNFDRPLMSNRLFRRALVYGLNRQAILDRLLQNANPRNAAVLTGPFPIGYAYDREVEPYEYAPRTAITLAEAARRFAYPDDKDGQLPPLVLAHPPYDVARVACAAIARQLRPLGIEVQLKELDGPPADETYRQYDLVYTTLAMWDPIVDARRVLGSDGIARGSSPYTELALRRLEQAGSSSWNNAASILHELHRITHDDVAVVPLWQLTDHYAYHASLSNVGSEPLTLYQNVERWNSVPRAVWKAK